MNLVDEAVDGDARLASSRRLDWRFLLPQPDLDHVVVLGRPDDGLVGALARFSADLETDAGAAEAASFDVAVAVSPTEADLARGAHLLRPGGWLYAELPRSSRRSSSDRPSFRRRIRRRMLRYHGFADVTVHGHWPTIATATEIVPLHDPVALALALSRHLSPTSRALHGPAARVLARTGVLARVAPEISVVARRV